MSFPKKPRRHSSRWRLGVAFSFVLVFAAAACAAPESGEDDGGSGSGGSGGSSVTTGGSTSGSGGSGVSGGGTAGSPTGGSGVMGGAGAFSGAGGAGAGGTTAGAGVSGNAGTPPTGGGNGGALPGGAGGAGGNAAGRAGSAGGGGRGGRGGAGAGGGGGNGGGGGGTTDFNPCPAMGPCEILPLGDSITDGLGVSGGGGYRIELFRLALMAEREITFVGGSMNGPQMVDGQTFPRSHEGHSGWTISQIDGIVPSPGLGPDPHIVLLHIGTNDMRSMGNGAPDRVGTLIDQIVMDLPDSLLVVAKIIPYPGAASAVTAFNNALPAIVQTRANAGKHVVLVDQFTGFPNDELADGVHPNAEGYARMARVWYAAISQYLR